MRLWVVAAVFAAVALTRSYAVGIPLRDPHGAILLSRLGISLGLFVVLSLVDAALRVCRRGWTARRTLDVLRTRWNRERLVLVASALLAYHLVYFCYHNLKSSDVLRAPRDAMLLGWDRWLFLGHSPAVLLHDLLGQHVAAYVLMVVYESFSWLATVSFVAAITLTTRVRDGYVFIASAVWVWILGVGSYYLIPSLGPFHSAPQDFAGLPHTMIQDTQARYVAQRAHLLAHPAASDSFAQISAFASLHVAVTTVLLLMARYYGLRRTARAMTVFLGGTLLATVYLGWHFAVDDLAGLVLAFVAVGLGRLTIYPRGRTGPVEGPLRRGREAAAVR
ncbi:inositol phosphorylceramide synthase [Nocardioides sp. KIGAM211]|uniref:Inositol phosphorylceramide synthase n=1 Tax=Nocardioides luti TaxID=2761101 RepID=A0A7X0RMP2_9ACTN|nr:inositol phosphorylceramide synthase [Nocardioides luti]